MNHIIRPDIDLQISRCHKCARWHASESKYTWECGHCIRMHYDALNETIAHQRRTISALRGAAKRRLKP